MKLPQDGMLFHLRCEGNTKALRRRTARSILRGAVDVRMRG